MTITPYTPQQFLILAKAQVSVPEKISILKRLSDTFPLDSTAKKSEEQLVNLLVDTNRYDEALQQYRKNHLDADVNNGVDFKLLEMLLRTGHYNDVLKATAAAPRPNRDFLRDIHLLELCTQALLAKGQYHLAHEGVDQWLHAYEADGMPGTRFEADVHSIQFLRRHLQTLERTQGPKGKAIFTASVPDSLQHWSQRRDVPIVFFKLIPTHPGGQLHEPLLSGRHSGDGYFESRVNDLDRGFSYLSGDRFSLHFSGIHTLYIREGDIDPESSGGHLLTSRVYAHTIPELYKLAGEAFVVLIDYRQQAEGEAAYMGDGIIHISASKLQTLVLMHEILHGLGATHQEWDTLEAQGYKFDPEDRGLMTFEHGEILDLGLEEKNRALLGWPQVGVVRPAFEGGSAITEGLKHLTDAVVDRQPDSRPSAPPAQRSSSAELLPLL